MAITLLEGFKYLPSAVSRYAAVNATSGVSTWSRVASRSGGYGLRHANSLTTDIAAVSGSLRIGVPPSFSIGWAANHLVNHTAVTVIDICGVKITGAAITSAYDISTFTGRSVGNINSLSSGGNLVLVDGSITTVGWHWWNLVGVLNNNTAGYIRLYRDGVLMTNVLSDTSGIQDLNQVYIYMGNANGVGGSGIEICDLVMRDDTTLIPDTRIDVLAPTSDVAAGWARSAGTTNFSLIDDAGPTVDSSDYVSANASGLTDTYGIADLPHNPSTIYAVGAHVIGRKDTGGSRGASVMVNSTEGPVLETGSNGTIYGYWETNPSGGAAWTKAAVDAMTAGIRTKT